jgi:pilus assembly protein Flp/PilA
MFGLISYARLFARTAIKSERGATMVEYALMVALIAVVALGMVALLGEGVRDTFGDIANQVPGGGEAE